MRAILALLLTVLSASAQDFDFAQLASAPGAAGTSCTSLAATNNGVSMGSVFDNEIFLASSLVASNDMTVCAVSIYCQTLGSPTNSISVGILVGNSTTNAPNTNQLVGAWSDWVLPASITANGTNWYKFPSGMNAPLTNGGIYWLTIRSGQQDAANRYRVGKMTFNPMFIKVSVNGSTWNNENSNTQLGYVLWQ